VAVGGGGVQVGVAVGVIRLQSSSIREPKRSSFCPGYCISSNQKALHASSGWSPWPFRPLASLTEWTATTMST
jgi:hypothetical protein